MQCRKATAREKAYRLADERGLYLFILPSGHKSWRLGYWFAKAKKRLVLGAYPDMSLQEAREERDLARKLVAKGIDPAVQRKQEEAKRLVDAQATFRSVAETFLAERRPTWAKRYAASVDGIFNNHLLPHWGSLPFGEITKPMVAQRLRAIETRGTPEIARRARQKVNELREWAEEIGYEVRGAGRVKAALKAHVPKLHPAITKLEQLRDALRAIEAAPCHPITRLCSRMIALTAMRPGTVQELPWGEVAALDPDEPLWLIPAARMKLRMERKALEEFDHLAPLAWQTVEVIEAAKTLTGHREFVFAGPYQPRRPVSNATVSKLYRDNGLRDIHVPHGWRSSFSTIMNERAMAADRPGDRAVIDLMLGHMQPGVEPKYNRAAYMPRRRELAQEWADLLLEGMPPASALLDGPRH